MAKIHDTFYNTVLQVNNMIPVDNYNHAERETMTHINYPPQNLSYLNKFVRVRYNDESEGHGIHNRFWISGVERLHYNQLPASYYLILRWDSGYPNKAILMNNKGIVIVAKTSDITKLVFPPNYSGITIDDFYNKGEAIFNRASDYESFMKDMNSEFIFKYPIQNKQYLGTTVYTEYYKDIKDSSLTNQFPATKYKSWNGIYTKTEVDLEMHNMDFGSMEDNVFDFTEPVLTMYDYGFEDEDTFIEVEKDYDFGVIVSKKNVTEDFGCEEKDTFYLSNPDTTFCIPSEEEPPIEIHTDPQNDTNGGVITFEVLELGIDGFDTLDEDVENIEFGNMETDEFDWNMDADTYNYGVINLTDDDYFNKKFIQDYSFGLFIADDSGERETTEEDTEPDKIEFLYDELLLGDPTLSTKAEYLLRGFPHVYDRHRMSHVDRPRRAINKGIIIRADKSSGGCVVVMEIVNGDVRVVTDKEAYFYTSTTLLQKESHVNSKEFMSIYQNAKPKEM